MSGVKQMAVVAAVIRNGDKLLLCDRPPDKPPRGWEFPGGKIEPGETPEEALRRELREELALDVMVFDQIYVLRHFNGKADITLHFMRCLARPGAHARPQERQHCRWVEIADAALFRDVAGAGLLESDLAFAEFLGKGMQ